MNFSRIVGCNNQLTQMTPDKILGMNHDLNKETKKKSSICKVDGDPLKSNRPVTLPTQFMKRHWKDLNLQKTKKACKIHLRAKKKNVKKKKET